MTNRESVPGGFEGFPHSDIYRPTPTITSSGSRPPSPVSAAADTLAATRWVRRISLNINNPELARFCAIYNLSAFFLGCCPTLWSFLVQISRVFNMVRVAESTRRGRFRGHKGISSAARESCGPFTPRELRVFSGRSANRPAGRVLRSRSNRRR